MTLRSPERVRWRHYPPALPRPTESLSPVQPDSRLLVLPGRLFTPRTCCAAAPSWVPSKWTWGPCTRSQVSGCTAGGIGARGSRSTGSAVLPTLAGPGLSPAGTLNPAGALSAHSLQVSRPMGDPPAYKCTDSLGPVGAPRGPCGVGSVAPFTVGEPGPQRSTRASPVTQLICSEVRL